jgi:hypothetical protein
MADEIYMSEDQQHFMRLLGQLPARLTAEQAAWVVNCQPHDVLPSLRHACSSRSAIRRPAASNISPRPNCWNRPKTGPGWPK